MALEPPTGPTENAPRRRRWPFRFGLVVLGLMPVFILVAAFSVWRSPATRGADDDTPVPLTRRKGDPIVLEPGAIRSGTLKFAERTAFHIEVIAGDGDKIDIGVGPTAGAAPTGEEVQAALAGGDRRVPARWHTLSRALGAGSFVWAIRNAAPDRCISVQVYLSHPSDLTR